MALLLPIAQRAPAASEGQAPPPGSFATDVDVQLGGTADGLPPPYSGSHEALAGLPDPGSEASGSQGTRASSDKLGLVLNANSSFVVKNTFIDVEEEPPDDAKARGSKTCMGRLSGAGPSPLFQAHDPEAFLQGDEEAAEIARVRAFTGPPACGLGLETDASGFLSSRDWAVGDATPFLETPGGALSYAADSGHLSADAASMPVPFNSGMFAPMMVQHLPAPPAYAAPIVFTEEETTPPPPAPPGTQPPQGGAREPHEPFGSGLSSGLSLPSDAASASAQEDELSNMVPFRVNIKHTFIDVEGDQTPLDQRYAQSCVARLSTPQPQFYGVPGAQAPGPLAAMVAQTPATVHSPTGILTANSPTMMSLPSVGSQQHGTLTPDGQPACQPCAWYYKDTGCHNEKACRYCHLCPQGELKNRKKLKIARLRNQESPVAETTASTANSPTAVSSSGQHSATPESKASGRAPASQQPASRGPLCLSALLPTPAA